MRISDLGSEGDPWLPHLPALIDCMQVYVQKERDKEHGLGYPASCGNRFS